MKIALPKYENFQLSLAYLYARKNHISPLRKSEYISGFEMNMFSLIQTTFQQYLGNGT